MSEKRRVQNYPADLAISMGSDLKDRIERSAGRADNSQCLFASGAPGGRRGNRAATARQSDVALPLRMRNREAGSGSCAPPGALAFVRLPGRRSHIGPPQEEADHGRSHERRTLANSGQISLGRDRRSRQEPVSSSTGRGHVRLPPFATRFAASPRTPLCAITGREQCSKRVAQCVAVGTRVTSRPPHRSVHETFPHTAPTSGPNASSNTR